MDGTVMPTCFAPRRKMCGFRCSLGHGPGRPAAQGNVINGEPVPTIRLENFRDGLEDYAAVLELERRLNESDAAGDAAAGRREAARAALTVPEELVHSLTEFSRDSAVLLAWRRRLDDLIEAAPRPTPLSPSTP